MLLALSRGFDVDGSGTFELPADRVFVGYLDSRGKWFKTLFVISFQSGSAVPKPNDVYRLVYDRPFFVTDSLLFKVLPQGDVNKTAITSAMGNIQVVPNPYVATNHMEPAVANQFLNQRRRIMFTHLPSRCDIKIFTVSGVLVDVIHAPEDGMVSYTSPKGSDLGEYNTGSIHWDLLTDEGLVIAAGMYFFHVKDKKTGKEKIGKFAVVK